MAKSETEVGYTVLARRYRPVGFEEVVGQEHVSTTLRNAIRENRIGHAYLFAGPRGVGKTSMARIFAKALNCLKGPTETPCGKCELCIRIQDGSDTDVTEMDAASNRGVDDARVPRSKGMKMRSSSSGAMPIPWSRTDRVATSPSSSTRR